MATFLLKQFHKLLQSGSLLQDPEAVESADGDRYFVVDKAICFYCSLTLVKLSSLIGSNVL